MTTYSLWVGNGYIDHNRNTTQGRADVATCKNLIGNRCYIQYHGGQMEQVLEEGVSISYFSSLDKAKAAVDELHRDGIRGSISINIEETEGNPQELEIIPPVLAEPTSEEEPAEIDPAELLEDLDTGDHGDRLNDYRDSSSYNMIAKKEYRPDPLKLPGSPALHYNPNLSAYDGLTGGGANV